ncbi:MAG: uncharacterized protein KVP18_001386, partial [Porospora cf. gigantea A]|uniref:uncharacterized protein n=1 Tax=Porospora cf. gigantea A TaxID=2853593 RepID=UPI003559F813
MRLKQSRLKSGSVLYNGRRETKASLQRFVKYVMATDQLHPFLTVEETLGYAAELRLSHLTPDERRRVVDELINELELDECRHTIIGGEWRKGCSTGQIKRVSIGLELLGDPSVLYLDEPTTGLDANLAYELIRILKRICLKQGCTIVCAVHQPRSQVFNLFDQVLLMSRGRIIFHGPPQTAVDYFTAIGYPCPASFNPADHFLELISAANVDTQEVVLPSESRKEKLNDESVYHLSKEELEMVASAFWSCEHGLRVLEEIRMLEALPTEVLPSMPQETHHRTQFRAMYMRTTMNTLRNPMSIFAILLIQILQGLMLGGLNFQVLAGVRDIEPLVEDPTTLPNVFHKDYMQTFLYGLEFDGKRHWLDVLENGIDRGTTSLRYLEAGTTEEPITAEPTTQTTTTEETSTKETNTEETNTEESTTEEQTTEESTTEEPTTEESTTEESTTEEQTTVEPYGRPLESILRFVTPDWIHDYMQCVTTSAEGFDLASFGYVNYYDKDHWDGPSTRRLRESVDDALFDRFAQLKDPLLRTLEDSNPSLDIGALEQDAMMGVQLVD